jgi:hypothetical protein
VRPAGKLPKLVPLSPRYRGRPLQLLKDNWFQTAERDIHRVASPERRYWKPPRPELHQLHLLEVVRRRVGATPAFVAHCRAISAKVGIIRMEPQHLA